MNRIKKAFEQDTAKTVYTTCGYPNLKKTEEIVLELANQKTDIIEIGFPFSDPMADGSVIQKTSQLALKHGITMKDYFNLIKNLRKKTQIPLILMTYANIIYHYGYDKIIQKAKEVGLDGFIIPDMELEENSAFSKKCQKFDLANIMIASENTTSDRLKKIITHSTGFIYIVSQPGVTGSELNIRKSLITFSKKIKKLTSTPLAVGFGISSTKDVETLKEHFNGIIVGSAFLKPILESKGNYAQGLKAVKTIFSPLN